MLLRAEGHGCWRRKASLRFLIICIVSAAGVELDIRESTPAVMTPFDLATRFMAVGTSGHSTLSVDGGEEVTSAKDLFTMQCAVAFASLPGGKYQPYSKLGAFCSTTDQAVKCKQVVVDGLEKATVKGNRPYGDTAFSDWCISVWEWFEVSYGQLCLNQCLKWQCRSTCEWIQEQGKYQDMDLAVYEAEEKLKDEKQELKSDGEDLRRKTEDLGYRERKVASLRRKATFATNTAQDVQWRLGNATEKERTMDIKVQEMKGMLRDMRGQVRSAEETLLAEEGKEEKVEQKAKQSMARLRTVKEDVAEVNAQLEEMKLKKEKSLVDLGALTQMADEDAKRVASMGVTIQEEETTALARSQALDAEEAALAAELQSKGPSSTLDIKKQLLRDERAKLNDLKSEIAAMKHKKAALEDAIKHAKDKVAKMKAAGDAKYAKAESDKNAILTKAQADITALQSTLAQENATVAAQHTATETARANLMNLEEKNLQGEKTLPFLAGKLKDVREEQDKLEEEDLSTRNDRRVAVMKLNAGVEDVEEAKTLVNTTNATVVRFGAEISERETNLTARRAEVNGMLRAHARQKPFIVEHHDLKPDDDHEKKKKEIEVAHMR